MASGNCSGMCFIPTCWKNGKIEDPFLPGWMSTMCNGSTRWTGNTKPVLTSDPDAINRDRIALDFKGLDTYADVFCERKPRYFRPDNMFREWLVDVKPQVKEGDRTELRILFRSPIAEGNQKIRRPMDMLSRSLQMIWLKSGQVEGNKMVFGVYPQSWLPFLAGTGGPPTGFQWLVATCLSHGLGWCTYRKFANWNKTRFQKKEATLTAIFEIEANADNQATVTIEKRWKWNWGRTDIRLTKGISTYPVDFKIENPKLWWTQRSRRSSPIQYQRKTADWQAYNREIRT